MTFPPLVLEALRAKREVAMIRPQVLLTTACLEPA